MSDICDEFFPRILSNIMVRGRTCLLSGIRRSNEKSNRPTAVALSRFRKSAASIIGTVAQPE
jgi:hypothetical protein